MVLSMPACIKYKGYYYKKRLLKKGCTGIKSAAVIYALFMPLLFRRQ